MRRMVAIAVVLALMSNCTYSLRHYRVYARGDIIELNETIGDVIDAQERAEYDLFPDMGGFKEARFYAISDGGYEVEIVTDRGKYVSVNRDTLAPQILKDYLLRYNTPQYNQNDFEIEWKIVEYDILGFPITQREVDSNLRRGCCIGATAGCGLASLSICGPVFIFLAVPGPWGTEDGELNVLLGIAILTVGTLVGVFTGYLVGSAKDRQRTIDAIGEARIPRMVE